MEPEDSLDASTSSILLPPVNPSLMSSSKSPQYYTDDWGYDGEDTTYDDYDWEA